MKRVVITGFGIISPIGNDETSITDSLRNGSSGLKINQDYIDNGPSSLFSGIFRAAAIRLA